MSVSLTKGGNVSLTKEAGGTLTSVTVGLGWDARTTDGADFDLDASALGVDANGKVPSDPWFVFFNNQNSPGNSIVHSGDNLTGSGQGDDEQIKLDLANMDSTIDRIVIPVSIYDAETRKQNFGQVSNAFIRIVNDADGSELARFDLSEDFAGETLVQFGEVYRKGDEWKFKAVGQGYASGLNGIAKDFGVNV